MCIRDRAYFCHLCDFMMGLIGRPCTKFEVDTFGHCINIKEKPQIFGSSPSLGSRPFFWVGFYDWLWQTPPEETPLAQGHAPFSSGCDFIMGLANSSCIPNLKSLALAVAEILKDNPKILGNFHSPWTRPLFPLGVILLWALANPSCVPNLRSLASAVAEISKGTPKFWELP